MGFLIGMLGGFFGGLAGIGGGVVMIPLMVSLRKISQLRAHGTSLVAVVFTGLAGAITYSLHKAVDWKVAVLLAVSAIVTARLGALYAHSLPEKKLKKAFGIFLLFISVLLLLKPYLPRSSHELTLWVKAGIFILTGAATGFLSGMMGVGGGTVMIPPMVLLAGMDQHLAQGTSLLAMVPVGLSGALTHYRLSNVQADIVLGLAAGSIAGSYLGGTAANFLPEFYLRLLFASLLVWTGLRYAGVTKKMQ